MDENDVTQQPTTRARQECAEFLVKCLGFGWSRDDLDELEALWWRYHDHTGKLVAR